MPKFNVMVNWTRTIEASFEIEVSAKDEEGAQEKAEAKVEKALERANGEKGKPLLEQFDWEETSDNDEFEYDTTEL